MGESQPQKLTSSTNQVVNTRYKLSRQLPVWSVFALFSIVWMVAFSGYYFLLHSKSKDVLIQLNQILQ
jgi:type VI secretion system protein ImpK